METASITFILISFFTFIFLGRLLWSVSFGGCITKSLGFIVLVMTLFFLLFPKSFTLYNNFKHFDNVFSGNPLLVNAIVAGFLIGFGTKRTIEN